MGYMTMISSNHLQLEHMCIHKHVDKIAKDVIPITLHGVNGVKRENKKWLHHACTLGSNYREGDLMKEMIKCHMNYLIAIYHAGGMLDLILHFAV